MPGIVDLDDPVLQVREGDGAVKGDFPVRRAELRARKGQHAGVEMHRAYADLMLADSRDPFDGLAILAGDRLQWPTQFPRRFGRDVGMDVTGVQNEGQRAATLDLDGKAYEAVVTRREAYFRDIRRRLRMACGRQCQKQWQHQGVAMSHGRFPYLCSA